MRDESLEPGLAGALFFGAAGGVCGYFRDFRASAAAGGGLGAVWRRGGGGVSGGFACRVLGGGEGVARLF